MKSKILLLKIELKNLAKEIKVFKNRRCEKNGGYVPGLFELRSRYRHMHVVYCLARGRDLSQVDSGEGLNMSFVNFQLEALKGDKKLYVIVDSKLSAGAQIAQACHAMAEHYKKYPRNMWNNGTIVVLKEDMGRTNYFDWMHSIVHECAWFKEPDMKDALTAYTVFSPEAEEYFKNHRLV